MYTGSATVGTKSYMSLVVNYPGYVGHVRLSIVKTLCPVCNLRVIDVRAGPAGQSGLDRSGTESATPLSSRQLLFFQ